MRGRFLEEKEMTKIEEEELPDVVAYITEESEWYEDGSGAFIVVVESEGVEFFKDFSTKMDAVSEVKRITKMITNGYEKI